ncbi:MAG: AAA family ATPase [Oscillospiraceae bacterium]|jgi:predicted ATPase|nr:AAA family ATPase [Oscillospiraceae bacterium]
MSDFARQYVNEIGIDSEGLSKRELSAYPYALFPSLLTSRLNITAPVTFFVGDNGSGKSTLLEAVAVFMGFNPEGGTRNFRFSTYDSHSPLAKHLYVNRGVRKPTDGFFLRAESFYNTATYIASLDDAGGLGAPVIGSYGGVSLHEKSHGESFLSVIINRFGGNGLYLLDEPESALSFVGQLSLLRVMRDLARDGASQFIVATHSPILTRLPDADIFQFANGEIEKREYEDTDITRLYRAFFASDKMLRETLED